jgi:hypothetical protein
MSYLSLSASPDASQKLKLLTDSLSRIALKLRLVRSRQKACLKRSHRLLQTLKSVTFILSPLKWTKILIQLFFCKGRPD